LERDGEAFYCSGLQKMLGSGDLPAPDIIGEEPEAGSLYLLKR